MKPENRTGIAVMTALLCGTFAALAPVASAAQAAEPVPNADACGALASLKLTDTEIASATSLVQNAPVPNSGLASMFSNAPVVGKAPAPFCRVVGHIRPTPTSDIGFEVWMPTSGWDGRLHGIGIGGFAGAIDYFSLGSAIKAGQAGVATDTGHQGTMVDHGWAKGQPEKVRDYGWRGVHLSTVAAKQIVAAFYKRGPDKSYFVGCSGGGRQGLVEAARFPDDYDGIASSAPAASFTEIAMSFTNAVQAQNAPDAAIRPEQAKLLSAEVLRQCDGGDGQVDGLVADPRQCRFDAAKLACGSSASPLCFSDPQLAALKRIQSGPRTSTGKQLAAGYLLSGGEAGNPGPMAGWENFLLGTKTRKSGGEVLADGMLDSLIQAPFATPASFDWDKDPARLKAASRELDAPTDLSRFFARGGKLILWHGWSDPAIPPEATLRYHAAMQRQSGAKAAQSSRLFMVPGVQHCFGGPGPDAFGQAGAPAKDETPERNMVLALQQWVEGKRAAPETLVGRRGHGGAFGGAGTPGPERQRLLCAWPKRDVLKSGADPDRAESYSCK